MISNSREETAKIAKEILNSLDTNILGLQGDLGAGKTTFTQELAKHLGVDDIVNSPTFVIYKKYNATVRFKNLYHFDCYRLENGRELLDLGFEDIVSDPNNLIVLEWPERVNDVLPPNMLNISFKVAGENKREIKWKSF